MTASSPYSFPLCITLLFFSQGDINSNSAMQVMQFLKPVFFKKKQNISVLGVGERVLVFMGVILQNTGNTKYLNLFICFFQYILLEL